MALATGSAARGVLQDAGVSASDTDEFIASLNTFLASDDATLAAPTDPAKLIAWGQTFNLIATELFASARAIAAQAAVKPPSPKKVYALSLSEYELWQELEAEKTKSASLDPAALAQFPSSEVFLIDRIGSASGEE
jgi:hypothetical protein